MSTATKKRDVMFDIGMCGNRIKMVEANDKGYASQAALIFAEIVSDITMYRGGSTKHMAATRRLREMNAFLAAKLAETRTFG